MTTAIFSDIQNYGVYYRGPIQALKDEYQDEFRQEYDLMETDTDTIVTAELNCFDDLSEIEYAETDYSMWEDLKTEIFNKKYENYIEYTTCGNWRGQSGYRFRTSRNVLDYEEDFSMDYLARNKSYKAFHFVKSNHDVYSASHYYIGLNSREYQKLQNASFEEVEAWVLNYIDTVTWIEKW